VQENAEDNKPQNNNHPVWINPRRRNGNLPRKRLPSFIIPARTQAGVL